MDDIFTNIGKLHVKNIHSPEYLKERIRNKVNQLAKYFIDDCDFIMGTTGGGSVLVKVRKVKENNKPEKTISLSWNVKMKTMRIKKRVCSYQT